MKGFLLILIVSFSFLLSKANAKAAPVIVVGPIKGIISACAGNVSIAPFIQQFSVLGNNLSGDISVDAPVNFQVSLALNSGYSSNAILLQSSGKLSNVTVYVRSASSAPIGNIAGNILLTSLNAGSQSVAVNGTINALPIIDPIPDQNVNNGDLTVAANFTGSGSSIFNGIVNTVNWTNNNASIGLPLTGSGNISSFTAVNTGSSPVTATIIATGVNAGAAYVANSGDYSISVINTATNNVSPTIQVGGNQPFGIAVSPDGSKVYTSNQLPDVNGNFDVFVINTTTNQGVALIVVGSVPKGICISPDGSRLYVANFLDGTVSVINTATNTVSSTIKVGPKPYGVAVNPDGSKVYVTQNSTGTVSVINALTGLVTSAIAVGPAPAGLALSPDGNSLYVANQDANTVSVISAANNKVLTTITVGKSPFAVAISPDGSKVYVSDQGSNAVSVISTAANSVTASIQVGVEPEGLSVTPDGSRLYVANYFNGTASVINTATNGMIATVPVGAYPIALGNFISAGTGCSGPPVKFTITVQPASQLPPVIKPGIATGKISACAGMASSFPQVQHFTVSASSLKGNLAVAAPFGFQVSLASVGGYSNSLTLVPVNSNINSVELYVRSSPSASPGTVSGQLTLTSAGAVTQSVAVNGVIYALPSVNTVPNETILNGKAPANNFTGIGNTYTWTNDMPGIGLAAAGTGNIAPFNAVNTGAAPVVAHITVSPSISGYAYITNYNSNNVSVISTLTNQVVATIPVGPNPSGVAISQDGSRVYVANFGSNTVSVINASSNTVIATVAVGVNPYGLTLSPDGKHLYVSDFGQNMPTQSPGGAYTVVNTANNIVISRIPMGFNGPQGVVISPDGSRIYFAFAESNLIAAYNTATNTAAGVLYLPNSPSSIVLSPDGSRFYIIFSNSNTLLIINANDFSHGNNPNIIAIVQVGVQPSGVALSPDGGTAYVTNQGSGTVSVINTANFTVTATVGSGANPSGVSVSPDGLTLYVTNSGSNTVSVISTANNSIAATVPVGSSPSPAGSFISGGAQCSGKPVGFTITVYPSHAVPVISAGLVTGSISACFGTPSEGINIQQVSVSGSNLNNGITAAAPPGFEISLSAVGGFATSLTIPAQISIINGINLYIRSSASAPAGDITGTVVLSSDNTISNISVSGTINPLPVVNAVPGQVVTNGTQTKPINFTGTGSTFTWVNDNPGIGLPASGSGSIGSFTGVNKGSKPLVANVTVTPLPTAYAYIPHTVEPTFGFNDTLSVINTSTNKIISSIITAYNPTAIAVSHDGGKVYVTTDNSYNLFVINTATNTPVATIPITGGNPNGIALSPDGTKIYVGVLYLTEGSILVIDTKTYAKIALIPVGSIPQGIVVSPDGAFVYVANGLSYTVSVISTATNTVTATITGFSAPNGVVISHDGTRLYVSNSGELTPNPAVNTVSVVNTVTGQIIDNISVGTEPAGLCISSDDSRVYVTNELSNTVSVINTVNNTVISTIPVGTYPSALSITPDGSSAYVLNSQSNNISLISTATNTVTATIPLGSNPYALGNFITPPIGCSGLPVKVTITVNPSPSIIATAPSGSITSCAGSASSSPNILQFTVSGSYLTGNINVAAPPGFEISLKEGTGFGNSLTLIPSSGSVNNIQIYVRTPASASSGNLSGNVVLTSEGATSEPSPLRELLASL